MQAFGFYKISKKSPLLLTMQIQSIQSLFACYINRIQKIALQHS